MAYEKEIEKVDSMIATLKQAFQPMPGGPPPGDPAMMQGGGAPMDPAMMQQGGPPPGDPAMQQGGPPPGDPAQLEAMLSEVMSAVEQVVATVEQDKQVMGQLQQQIQAMQQAHAEIAAKMGVLEKSLNAPSPMEGVPANMM